MHYHHLAEGQVFLPEQSHPLDHLQMLALRRVVLPENFANLEVGKTCCIQ